ncbi:MAG: RsiV family protein [Anaerolineales bacterium]
MKSSTRRIIPEFVLGIFLATMLACGSTPIPPPATATASLPPPTQIRLPTQTSIPLYRVVTLTSISRNETSATPEYTEMAQIPALQGSSDVRVTNFNNEMVLLTQEEFAKFKDNAAETRPTPGMAGNSYDQQYKLLSPPGNLLSLRFQIKTYIYETAHPNTHNRTVTYDLEAGADIQLEQLFLPGSDYLGMIANYCIAQLKTRNIGFDAFASGAQPNPENYGNWNITQTGLLITFNESQVAPFAAGAQEVTVPYAQLQSVIDPHGPLAGFLP